MTEKPKLLGVVNWRTTWTSFAAAFTGLLTILAMMPYELGAVADLFPHEWKARIVIVGAAATFILRCINGAAQKDAHVAGNGTLTEPHKVSRNDGTNLVLPPDDSPEDEKPFVDITGPRPQ